MTGPRITLDQWSALVAVVEAGGYAQASQRLHRTQSTVTYTIKKLEDLLGLKVFELRGRKAQLTPAGQALYRRGKALLEEAARVERAARELARGWEPEIRIAVDIIFPTWLLLECCAEFGREHPDTRIEITESVLGGTEEALTEGRVDFGGRTPGGRVPRSGSSRGSRCRSASESPRSAPPQRRIHCTSSVACSRSTTCASTAISWCATPAHCAAAAAAG